MKSDSSTSSAGSEGSGSDSKERTAHSMLRHGAGRGWEVREDKVSHSLKGAGGGHSKVHVLITNASGVTTSTSTPTKSTPKTSEKPTTIQATLKESIQKISPPTTSFAEAFLANPSLLPVKEKVSKTLVARYSSRYAELRNITDLSCYYSKTLKVFSAMTEDELSQRSSTLWKSWGIGGSTKFLTARITGSHRTGKECSLSDILEKKVPPRYFLSQKQLDSLMGGFQASKLHLPFKVQDTHQETTEE